MFMATYRWLNKYNNTDTQQINDSTVFKHNYYSSINTIKQITNMKQLV